MKGLINMQNNVSRKKDAVVIIVTALKLLLICAFIAALVATVNYITKDRIAYNQKLNIASALSDIYSENGMVFSVDESGSYVITDESGNPLGSCEAANVELLEDIDAVYIIRNADGSVFGYCASASPMGFKGEVGMLVAVNPDGSAKAVKIVSLSDTKGIGDKVTKNDFLDKFKEKTVGFSSSVSGMSDIIIAGATRTSEPVTKAVDTALMQVGNLIDGGAENE